MGTKKKLEIHELHSAFLVMGSHISLEKDITEIDSRSLNKMDSILKLRLDFLNGKR